MNDIDAMRDLDIEQFWKDDDEAHKDNCFNPKATQVALGIRMSHECIFPELGMDSDPWGRYPDDFMTDSSKRYNDKAEKIVGRRLLYEGPESPFGQFPYVKRIGEIFEGTYTYIKNVEWLEGTPKTPEELEKLLDRVEKLDIESFIFPDDWDTKVGEIYNRTGKKPTPRALFGRHIRGPVTLAASIYGVENLLLLFYDVPELTGRFSRAIGDAIMALNKAIDKACGYNEENKPHGFSFADDNCCLLTPEFYEGFGYPVLKKIFDYWSPDEDDQRFQHSDSDMAHIVPILGRLNLNGVNFGPNVLVKDIRPWLPKARIDGCLAPFAFMRNEKENIVAQVKRDCQMAKESGIKGLNISTAGSINYGSSLESMRLVMQTIQNYGQY